MFIIFLLHTYRKAYGTRVYYFYKDKCPYCKKMQSAWDLFTSSCSWTMIVPIKIDCSVESNQKLRDDFGAKTVPHIVKVYGDKREKFEGERTSEEILSWAKKKFL